MFALFAIFITGSNLIIMADVQMYSEFHFQQSVKVHEGSVRALGTTDSVLCTGSIDKTSKLFLLGEDGKYGMINQVAFHEGFVITVVPM